MTAENKVCLLNPGPVTLTPRVRQALLGPDLCHREPDYAALQTDVRGRLARVYEAAAEDYAAALFTGSGTAAVEAMVSSFVPEGGRALVAANGVYGERVAAMLRAHGKDFDLVRSEWTRPIDLDAVADRLRGGRGYSHVLAVHHETTTGRLNDLAPLGALCRERGVPLLLDAVSSFGGEAIDFDGWNVEACAATANKCLHGVPGISFVLFRRAVAGSRPSGARTLYLDVFRNYEEQDKGYPLFTPAIQVLYALREALGELEEAGGWRSRQERYAALSRVLRGGLRELGLRLLLGDERPYASSMSSYHLPAGVSFQGLYEHLRRAGFVIYPGQQSLAGAIFRVALMGDLSRQDVERFVRTLAEVVR